MTARPAEVIRTGLWTNNAGLVQLLGLCPLLAVSTSLVNGLGLGIATTLVLMASNITVSLIRDIVRPEIRIPVFVLVIASFVTAVELVMNAWFHELFRVLGIFIPLIVTNCAIIGRAEAFASRQPPMLAMLDGLAMGLGFTSVLVVLGAARELLGQGSLFSGAHMMFGEGSRWLELQLVDGGFLLALLPPGAFFGLGLMVAAKNLIDAGRARRLRQVRVEPVGAAGEPA
ncbi:electron transport complex subunit E [Wenzhouxiangella sp. XN24]|uniref:electron transport complex subunit E n=1 Tax=Wenzhouxiangella sp. XN24 TaxID=2713569 RepID=UPI0013EB7499|nr:electron transport complex subunit E [Wenzhouxiangella sp. XN24]NGX15554.1 electron transport complex subunit E [Wenzhouxiangella sp. XN24]